MFAACFQTESPQVSDSPLHGVSSNTGVCSGIWCLSWNISKCTGLWEGPSNTVFLSNVMVEVTATVMYLDITDQMTLNCS